MPGIIEGRKTIILAFVFPCTNSHNKMRDLLQIGTAQEESRAFITGEMQKISRKREQNENESLSTGEYRANLLN